MRFSMLKKGYYYLFYKLYMLMWNQEIKWLPEGRAYVLLLIIGSLVFDSIISLTAILINQKELLIANARMFYTTFYIIFAIYNYIVFLHNDKWKKIIRSFSDMDKSKNIVGTLIIYIMLFIIIITWLYSIYLW